jgi:hypothetical protein
MLIEPYVNGKIHGTAKQYDVMAQLSAPTPFVMELVMISGV